MVPTLKTLHAVVAVFSCIDNERVASTHPLRRHRINTSLVPTHHITIVVDHSVHLWPHATQDTNTVVASSADLVCNS